MAGGGGSRTEDGKKKARIEIIPLIDVIFFLLATFVLFTLSLDKISSLPLNLPVANPQPQKENPDDVVIQVSGGDIIYWNKESSNLGLLPARLEQYIRSVSDPHVLVAGDDQATFELTVQVLDAIREAGLLESQFSVEARTTITGQR